MITITDGKEKFEIDRKNLWKRKKDLQGLATTLKYDYWSIELLFIPQHRGTFKQIVKCYPNGDAYLKVYENLDPTKKDYILLSKKDYQEVKRLYFAMQSDKDYKKEAIIEAVAIMFAYEWYQNYILEEGHDVPIDDVFLWIGDMSYNYIQYKKQIYNRAREILYSKYKITDKVFLSNGRGKNL